MFKTMKRLLHWAGPYRKRLWLGCICSFLSGPASAIPTMVAAWALGQVILAGWQGDTFPAALIGQSRRRHRAPLSVGVWPCRAPRKHRHRNCRRRTHPHGRGAQTRAPGLFLEKQHR